MSYTDDLDRLVQSTLVTQSSDRTEFRAHRLIQDVALAQIRQAEEMGLYFDAAVDLIWAEFPRITRGGIGRAHNVDRWKKCAQVFPHISRLRQFFVNFEDPKQKPQSLIKLAAAYNDLGATYSMNRLPSKAFPLLFKSKELRELMPAFEPEHNFSPLHELSLAYWHQCEYEEAAKCLLKALADREAALGPDDRQSVRTGQIFYALGNVRASQALMDESFMWHQKALIHFRATGGDKHYKTASACYRVAEHYIRNRQFNVARYVLSPILDHARPFLWLQCDHLDLRPG
jgi:tetratricopeptide (TPR) repeat protein